MSTFPIGIARVPNLLLSNLMLGGISRGQLDLARLQEQLATNKQVNRPSDDAVKAATISLLNERTERNAQITRNLQHADAALAEMDQALADASELMLEAKSIASEQVNATSSPTERAAQATVVDALIRSLFDVARRSSVAGYIFAGSDPGTSPVEPFQGGYRTVARGAGLRTDLGAAVDIPITLPGTSLGSTSARMVGLVDLAPNLSLDAELRTVRGTRGVGIGAGAIELSIDGGEAISIDLSQAGRVRDVAEAIHHAIRNYEAQSGRTILGPGGVGVSGQGLTLDLVSASPDPEPVLQFSDTGAGTTARDLGLAQEDASLAFTFGGDVAGDALAPTLAWTTELADLPGLTLPLGSIRLNNNARSAVIDFSDAQTLQDVRRRIEGAGLGVRVELETETNRLVVVNEVASGKPQAMSIAEIEGNGGTAAMLGIRTFDLGTRLAEFNDGRGVSIVHGATDPTTGLPSPQLNVDFTIRLGNGIELSIDLEPDDVTTVESLLNAVNTQAADQLTALSQPTTLFRAELGEGANGIRFIQDGSIGGRIEVQARNGSAAAEQLGLLDGAWDAASATLAGTDRATVRVDNLFTRLIDLRDALRSDDTTGITLAGGSLDREVERLAETRGLVGGYARRIQEHTRHTEDRALLDETVRSQLQDLDFAAAASRFTLLQTQLQAGYQSAASMGRLTLLDFLG